MRTKLNIVVLNKDNFPVEHYGVSRIIAYLEMHKINAKLNYISFTSNTDIKDIIKNIPEEVNLLGFSLDILSAKDVYAICRQLKKERKDLIIFVGSWFASISAKFILDDCDAIDFVILGEGELTTYQIVLQFEEYDMDFEKLPHVFTRKTKTNKKHGVVNIETMPTISREVLIKNKNRPFVSARINCSSGCIGKCSFCTFTNINLDAKRSWQGVCTDKIFKEVKTLNEDFNIKSFSFNDNSFEDPGLLGKQRINDFCKLVLQHKQKLHFWCYLRAETFTQSDIELIKLMKKAGFTQVFIGIEAGNKEDLLLYNKRATEEDNYRAFQLFTDNGIDVVPGFIMINPYSDKVRLKRNFEFLVFNKIFYLKLYYSHLWVYYGTKIYEKLLDDKLLDDKYSYIHVKEYRFVDSFTSQISQFFKRNFIEDDLDKQDDDLYAFTSTIALIKAIVPAELEVYSSEISKLYNDLSETLADFFSIIYLENDIPKAEKKVNSFKNKMNEIYLEKNKIKFKILKNKNILKLFKGE